MEPKSPPETRETPARDGGAPLQIYVISGGSGSSGQQLVRTVMAQYLYTNVPIRLFPKVYSERQIARILESAVADDALVIHTLVNPQHRAYAAKLIAERGLRAFDPVGPLLDILTGALGEEPAGRPGLYRDLHKSYFDRIDAINYTLDHDDGKNPEGWGSAEIVLVGVSRVGKTPLSLYLSVLGWKVANIPIIPGVEPRKELFEIDRRRVVGLNIDPSELVLHREHRQRRLGVGTGKKPGYIDPVRVYEETEAVRKFIRRSGFPAVDTTGKPIETIATEVTQVIQHRLNTEGRERGG